MAKQDLPPDGFVDDELPPDGFADDAPPDGFADDDKPSLSSRIKKGAVEAWSAFQEGVEFVGREMERNKDATGYRTSPAGLMEEAYGHVSNAAGLAGEKVAEGLASGVSTKYDPLMPGNVSFESTPGKGLRTSPEVAAVVGLGVTMAPDLALAAAEPTGALTSAGRKVAKGVGGLTSAGEKVAKTVAKSEAVAPMADNVIRLPTGEVRILDTAKVPQPIADKLAHSKEVAVKLETKLAKASEDLDAFTKQGPEGLAPTVREQEWLNRVDEMKTEHAGLLKEIQRGLFEINLNGRSKAFLEKLDELKIKKEQLLLDHETAPLVGPKERDLLKKIHEKRAALQNELRDSTTKQLASDVVDQAFKRPLDQKAAGQVTNIQQKMNVLDLIEQKAQKEFEVKLAATKSRLAQQINKLDTDINELGRDFGSHREQSLFKLKDKAKALEMEIQSVQGKYQMARMEKFAKQKDKLTEIAAYAENDLRNLGFTSKEIEEGFVKFVKGEPAGSKMVSAAQKGNVISKELHDGIIAAQDISGAAADVGQFTTNFDEVERLTKGAFSREVKQDLYNRSIQSYEISNVFLDKLNKLMEKHGLKDADGHTFTRYVEGQIDAPPGRESAFAAAKEEMRQITDEALDLRNSRRMQRGEEAIPRRENYITAALEQGLRDDLYIPAKDAAKAQFIKKKSAEFGFDTPRQDLIPEDMRMGAFEVIKMYTTKTAREVALSDSVEKLRALSEIALKSRKPNMANYLNSVADRITGEAFTAAVQNLSSAANRSKVLHKAMELGGNYSANVVNQLGAGLNQVNSVMLASKDIGVGRALLSVPNGFLTELKEQILKATANPAYESFATTNSKVLRLVTSKETAQALRVAEKYGPIASVNQWVFKFFNDALYKGVFNQAYKSARTSGYAHSLAVKVADAVVEKSQGIFEDALKPERISSKHPVLQLAAPLQTAVFNTFNVLKNDYFFAKLTPVEKAAAVGRFVATGAVTNAMIALATGKKPSAPDAIPFFRLAQLGIGGIFSPAVKLAKGDVSGAMEQGFLMTPQARALGGLQTLKTVKGAASIFKGETADPRVLLFGPKPKGK